jgi:hypothetical protein
MSLNKLPLLKDLSFMGCLSAVGANKDSCDRAGTKKLSLRGDSCAAAMYPVIAADSAAAVPEGARWLSIDSLGVRNGSSLSRNGLPGSLKRIGIFPVLCR